MTSDLLELLSTVTENDGLVMSHSTVYSVFTIFRKEALESTIFYILRGESTLSFSRPSLQELSQRKINYREHQLSFPWLAASD